MCCRWRQLTETSSCETQTEGDGAIVELQQQIHSQLAEIENLQQALSSKVIKLWPLKSGTLSIHLFVPVPVLLSIKTPTAAGKPSSPLNPFVPQIWLLLTTVHARKLYLLTYLTNGLQCFDAVGWVAGRASGL